MAQVWPIRVFQHLAAVVGLCKDMRFELSQWAAAAGLLLDVLGAGCGLPSVDGSLGLLGASLSRHPPA